MSRAVRRYTRTNPNLPSVGSGFGVVLYRIIGAIEGQETVTTFYFYSTVPAPTQTQLTTLIGNISTALFTAYKSCLSSDWTCQYERLDVVHSNTIAGVEKVSNFGTAGGRGTPHLPTQNAIVLLRQSAVKGQHGRGRISLPAVAEADVTNSTVTAVAELAFLTALGTAMMVTASDGANTWTPCIAQRSPQSPKLVVGFSALTSVIVRQTIGSVRRRKLGKGK